MTTEAIKILQSGRTFSLSQKSSISYEIGLAEPSDLVIRIAENSGTGQFSNEWVSLESIYRTLASSPQASSLQSNLLKAVLKSKGANTPSFLMASLLDLGLVKRSEDKPRLFQVGDTEGFLKRLQDLVNTPRKNKGVKTARARAQAPAQTV